MNELQSTVNQTLIRIAIACLTFAGAYATLYFRKLTDKVRVETEKLKDDKKKGVINEALNRLDQIAWKTVSALEQTTASTLRNSLELEKEERREKLKELAYKAYEEILKTLEPEYAKLLKESLGDFETYTLNTIEDMVRVIKEEKKD